MHHCTSFATQQPHTTSWHVMMTKGIGNRSFKFNGLWIHKVQNKEKGRQTCRVAHNNVWKSASCWPVPENPSKWTVQRGTLLVMCGSKADGRIPTSGWINLIHHSWAKLLSLLQVRSKSLDMKWKETCIAITKRRIPGCSFMKKYAAEGSLTNSPALTRRRCFSSCR